MKSVAQATQLAETIVQVANKLGTRTTAIVTDMNQPIGQMVGNACELIESIEVLKGQGPDDTRTLTMELGGQLLFELCLDTFRDNVQIQLLGKLHAAFDTGPRKCIVLSVQHELLVDFQFGKRKQPQGFHV